VLEVVVNDRIYAVITADIVGSTEYYKANGKPLRPRLLEVLGKVNSLHADSLAVPFTITLGDEFQGLVASPADSPRIVHDLRLQLSPLKCRIGVGIGPIVSELAESTSQMEGLAFAMSREALDQASKAKSGVTRYRCEDASVEHTSNTISLLMDAIQGRWTQKQWEALRLYSELADVSKVAASIGVKPPSVEDRLRPTARREMEQALTLLSSCIGSCAGEKAL
jgi:hypothetical protein